ncbi:hypothetical protein LXA43DRAFT_196791 [Ganoderma leucocontextum]|nr:hypothetical protein LXA43DRAFT_196791 [Ganoderma leucocontextum]
MAHGPQFHHAISTLFLDRLLSTHFRRRTTDEQVALITRISKVRQPEVMSFVYEPTILDVLCASAGGPSTTCHLADGTAFALGPSLVLAGDEVTADTVSVVPRDNHLYLLRSGSGFPWVNAFVISEDQARVTILQTTVNFRREVVSSTVRRVIELVRRSMPNASAAIKWSFVFVSPGARGEQMAKTLRAVQFRARRHPTVVAGWLEIGALLSYPQEVLVRIRILDGCVWGAR